MVCYSVPHSDLRLFRTFCLSVAILASLLGTSGRFALAAILSDGDVDVPNGLIGINSVGSLTVNDGSTQNNFDSSVGVNEGSDGTAIVTDGGSTWTNSGFKVGESGMGQLTVILLRKSN